MRYEYSILRAVIRLVRLFSHILNGLFMTGWYRMRFGSKWFDTQQGRGLIKRWAIRACRILAIHIEVCGVMSPVKGTLFVANHISWIDVIALAGILETKFIAKHTVKSWPLIGSLARSAGNLFIERDRYFALSSVIRDIRRDIKQDISVMVFPEGTTTDGWYVKRFYAGLFGSVTNTDCVVQGIALYYKRDGGIDELAPYINDNNFMLHLLRMASLQKTCLHVNLGIPFLPGTMSRHEIAAQAYSSIVSLLSRQRGLTPAKLGRAA